MSANDLHELESVGAFRPRFQFAYLALDHVPFDDLARIPRYETRVLEALQDEAECVSVNGPVGAGKSSAIAYVCMKLPDDHVSIRVPVAALDDPGDVKVFAGTILRAALRATASSLADQERETLEEASSDRVARAPRTTGLRGGSLGGGVIPAALQVEIGGLVKQYERDAITVDRLYGLERLIDILGERDLKPVFVVEDTDAVVGTADAEAFFSGPVRILARELDTASLIAVQSHWATSSAYHELRPGILEISLPQPADIPAGIRLVLQKRIETAGLSVPVDEVIADEGVAALAEYYGETNGSFRLVLAAIGAALEHAVPDGPEQLAASHIRYGIQVWTAEGPETRS